MYETNYSMNIPVLGYAIKYSDRFVRTSKNYHDSKSEIPEGLRMSTAGEELALQLVSESKGADSRKGLLFNDLFGRNDSQWRAQQLTETGLRVPQGRDANAYETDGKGRKYWPRLVLLGNKVVGEARVPEGHGRVVVEWNYVFGIPHATDAITQPHRPYTTHFWFAPGFNSDVDVFRQGAGWCGAQEDCFNVLAGYHYSNAGYRPVRSGSSVDVIAKTLADLSKSQQPPSVLTEAARNILRQTESSGERLRRQLMERPVDNLLRQMREPPRWQPPHGM